MANWTFGSYILNNLSAGLGNVVVGMNADLPTVEPVLFPIARRDGMKKSGEHVKERSIPLSLKVIGSSRSDLISRLDTLMQALSLRSQSLCLHDDGRYWQSVDAIVAPLPFTATESPASITVAIVFTATDPYAYSAAPSTYDTGTQTLTLASGSWNFAAINVTGGGNVPAFPLIRITNKTSTGSTTLTSARNSGTAYTTIAVAATSFSGVVGDTIIITHGATTQTLTVASNFSVGATTITVNSFTANANYVNGDTAKKNADWSSMTVTQTDDNLSISASDTASATLPNVNGDYIDFQCDPAATNGWTIQTNSSGIFSEPLGLFPTINPGSTPFAISIVSGCKVSAQAVLSWLPRWAT